jgi:tetratricopeptide (TPR) repeat protein
MNSEYAYAYNNRAFAYLYLSEFEKAKQDVQKSLELDSKNSYAYFTQAGIAAKEKRHDDFYQYLKQSIEMGFPIDERMDEPFLKSYLHEGRFQQLTQKN